MMDYKTIYTKNDYIERENRKIMARMESVFKTCSPLVIRCTEESGIWGIWFDIDNVKYLVNPIDLADSIFADSCHCCLDSYSDVKEGGEYYMIDASRDIYCYTWRLPCESFKDARPLHFRYEEYISKVRQCMETLYDAWLSGKSVAYGEADCDIEALGIAVSQLKLDATMPSYNMLMTSSVMEEKFVFDRAENTASEKYTIGIGDRKFTTWLTHWDNDYDKIRYQLESFVYNREARVELGFDLSDTVVTVKQVSVLDQVDESETGCAFKYRDYALVEILPNDFVHRPIIKGYCDVIETVRTFYEGLLRLALAHERPNETWYEHIPSQIEAYNMFKSPVIERFLSGKKKNSCNVELRQVRVKRVLEIYPDFDEVIIDFEGNYIDADTEDGFIDELYDKEGRSFCMPELVSWQREIKEIICEAAVGRECSFDWNDYHKRGIALASELRKRLSSDFDLWYSAPFEDTSGIVPRPFLVCYNKWEM